MILGFTGTQSGMTPKQIDTVTKLVNELRPDLVVHGDCIGADYDFNNICIRARGSVTETRPPRIRLRPSTIEHKRAYCEGYNEIMPSKEPLSRNKDIVNDCDKLIATPVEDKEQLRSGTWSTVRYAKRVGKVVYLVLPDGSIR